jgi:Tfp pilus assembly protein PilF
VPFDDPPGGPLAGDDNDAAAKAAAKRKSERKRLAMSGEPTGDAREEEDLRVAAFYQSGSNFRGAYLRATDAVSIDGDDPEAHFALAESARRLGKLDEALTNYKKTLTLDPVPKTKKAAEKAVKELEGGSGNALIP